jgi:hypothetical protein
MCRQFLLRTALSTSLFVVTGGWALAQKLTLQAAEPSEQGSLGPAHAATLHQHGALPFSDADVAAKAAADKAHAELEWSGALQPASPSELAAAGVGAPGANVPAIVGGLNFGGQHNANVAPPDTTGAIGPSRYIQLVNETAAIYNRITGAVIVSGTLNTLAGLSSTVNTFDPQMMWDPGTSRFYYVMDSIFSATDNRLSFGFSTTANPANLTTNWCHYTLGFGSFFPDYPKLGDSAFFAIIGSNGFAPGFVGSDIVAISKPPAGTGCPSASSFKLGAVFNIKDSTGAQVFTPVPANQVDPLATGYVVTRSGPLPATNLWIFNVTKGGTGLPVFGTARAVPVASYTIPPNASQSGLSQLLDTLDARPTNAVQAFNPVRNTFSLWTQHTIETATASEVRVYEINPAPVAPTLLRSIDVAATNVFLFNGSVSPDRRRNGAASAFGDSVVFDYSVSSPVIFARIVAGSSLHGAAPSFLLVKAGVAPYRDFTCPNPGDTCRWGDYSGASPDPGAPSGTAGQVWGANQFDGVVNPSTGSANWRTQIFALKP